MFEIVAYSSGNYMTKLGLMIIKIHTNVFRKLLSKANTTINHKIGMTPRIIFFEIIKDRVMTALFWHSKSLVCASRADYRRHSEVAVHSSN